MTTGTFIHITGIVQGVGFRPWVWRTATRLGLTGSVRNDFDGVKIELYGDSEAFLRVLESNPPPLARIDSVEVTKADYRSVEGFAILDSERSGEALLRVSPDISICDDCLQELFDPNDRRYRYPFINCVNCGPRFSIIESLPYDRPRTSMRAFEMCPSCRTEYSTPADRRYHAQPVACSACGPRVEPDDWETVWKASMKQGKIVAVKGVGGFHLACDALNAKAVAELRSRKGRENKPFALMVPDLEWLGSVCDVSPEEERLLCSRERPIVLLKQKQGISGFEMIAPGLDTLGVMLPYSPMHQIMFDVFPHPVVMTSANYSSEPMIHSNEDALQRLDGIADLFLLHDREIINRCDDSVCAVSGGQTIVIRPGRGIAPVSMPVDTERCILAFGADMKNTFALAHHGQLTLHPYIGDLAHPETQRILERAVQQQLDCFQVQPELIVHDLHPDYFSTTMARQLASRLDVPTLAVQHHHAHAVGAYPGTAIGFTFDGTGYGTDETIWGGEVMLYDAGGFTREFHLLPFALPGGDAAIKDPFRTLISLLRHVDATPPSRPESDEGVASTLMMLESGINCPMTTSMGRLFDAVSCLLGVCEKPTYDGEAAMRLEAIADPRECGDLAFRIDGGEIDWRPLMLGLVDELEQGIPVPILASRFHNTLAEIVYCCGKKLAKQHGRLPWVFSGGVFQNRLLVERIRTVVGDEFELVFSVYPNDSGISAGQIIAGARQWESR